MNLATKLFEIRKQSGMTQADFADILFVTRQAVSRWENGETTPTIDTLKTISQLFHIDANLFFVSDALLCQSCAMPLKSIDDLGQNIDMTANVEYCKYCFDNGAFSSDKSVEEMVENNLKFLRQFNADNGVKYSEEEARQFLTQYLPTLKRWKKA